MGERGRRKAVAALALVAVFGAATVALPAVAEAGEDVTLEELRTLAGQAASDPESLNRLRQVDRVDGRPADLRRALDGAEGEVLRSRLRILAGGGYAIAPDAGDRSGNPQKEAGAILDGRRYKPAPALRPFRGVLRRLADWLRPVGEPVGRLWNRVAGNTAGRLFLVLVVIGAAVVVTMRLIRRRTTAGVHRGRTEPAATSFYDPDDLDREADTAEEAGELERAFRLRFRAGLLRLDQAGAIAYRPALTTGELTRRVQSGRLHNLASAFEEIAYGGRPVDADDLRSARADWPRVLEEVARR